MQLTTERGSLVSPVRYVRERPYRFALSVIGSVVGFVFLLDLGELTKLTAFGIAYVGDSVAHRAGAIAQEKLR